MAKIPTDQKQAATRVLFTFLSHQSCAGGGEVQECFVAALTPESLLQYVNEAGYGFLAVEPTEEPEPSE